MVVLGKVVEFGLCRVIGKVGILFGLHLVEVVVMMVVVVAVVLR